MTAAMTYRFQRDTIHDRWIVIRDGRAIGEVYQERQPGGTGVGGDLRASRGSQQRGKTRWVNGTNNSEDFTSRAAAAEDLVRQDRARRFCPHCETEHGPTAACASSGMPLDAPEV